MRAEAGPYEFLRPAHTLARGSITAEVTALLREAIVNLELKPGEAIDRLAVCERLGVSRSPVAEALARLQSEGLVEVWPQRGTSVSYIRLAEVEEDSFIRSALESEVVRHVAPHADAALLAALDANIADQDEALAAGDRPWFHRLDTAFHGALLEAFGSPRVRLAVETARFSMDRARRMIASPGRMAITVDEHRAVVAALHAGDGEAAAGAMRAHMRGVLSEVFVFADQAPDLFADGREAAGRPALEL